MTGLPPKASRPNANKHANIGSPVVIKSFSPILTDEKHSSIDKFLNCTSAEEQLGILLSIIEEHRDCIDDGVIQFLAVVYYESPAKHPVKCLLSRHVTKCSAIQKSFTKHLTTHIISDIKEPHDYMSSMNSFDYYTERVPKLMICMENFPCGALAVESVGVHLLTKHLFFGYFAWCREPRYREMRTSPLSPTKKNEMFTLEHLILRLIIHVLQKHSESVQCDTGEDVRSPNAYEIMRCVEILIWDEEVPMDTKSLCGILFLLAHQLQSNSLDSWNDLLLISIDYSKSTLEGDNRVWEYQVLKHKIGRLALYYAIATTVSIDQLQEHFWGSPAPAILMLLEELLTYADGASQPEVTVCVSRALLQLSRSLGGLIGDEADDLGGRIVAALLPFVWSHLEFHLDSVRHQANQILAACLAYCAGLDTRGITEPLEGVLRAVASLGEARSFYWAVSSGAAALGGRRVLADLCPAAAVLRAAATPHLQAAASAAVVALLANGACAGLQTSEIFECWVRPALGSPAALQAVLPSAIAADAALPEYISVHVHGREALACVRAAPACHAHLTQRALWAAAVHTDEETRILALSLVAECGRSTACVSRAELACVLWFLRYNLAAPRPGFRTALLANLNKLLKRLEDSHRSLSRRGACADHYGPFLEELRALCFAAALPGASHGRRNAALQLLAATSSILPTVARTWKAQHVETLLRHLEDGYDCNKAAALQALQPCPDNLLEDSSRELSLAAVLGGAVSLRAAGGAVAAAKLQLLLTRLPHRIPLPDDIHLVREEALRPHYALLKELLRQLGSVARWSMAEEAHRGGAPGTLHCVLAVLRDTTSADWSWPPWSVLAVELVETCVRAGTRAHPVVAHDAPEGYLPVFPSSAIELDWGEGEAVTAQMVLVCAWRTVKESSAVLGLMAGLAKDYDCWLAGEHLLWLLREAKHRGAVEQAALGLAAVAHVCWSRESLVRHPRHWTRALLAEVEGGALGATRRGAGLPAAIQALVTSEVSGTGRAECFHECMAKLLELAGTGAPGAASDAAVARRTLAANVLRALFRHAALEKVAQAHVGAGLEVALRGFEAAAWPERTGMSLLFSALCVRVFGVARTRGPALHARNTLPAGLLFQRYPRVHDLMLSKLQEFEPGGAAGPAVLPVLLLLARVYPSAAEGAVSSLKVSAFVPLVQRCACASELLVRRLAARTLPALLPPAQHLPYISRLLAAVSRPGLLHNHWHGALLTLASLLERASAPPPRASSSAARATPSSYVAGTLGALTQATGPRPCYVVAMEYVTVLNLLIWKFPEMVPKEMLYIVSKHLDDLVFSTGGAGAANGARGPCLAASALLYFILLHKGKQFDRILPLINRTLLHPSYEVVLSALDYLLIQHNAHTDTEACNLRRHLLAIRDVTILETRQPTSDYTTMITKLGECAHDRTRYQECSLKCIQLLSLEDNTQLLIVNETPPVWDQTLQTARNEWIVMRLLDRIQYAHIIIRHLYLASLIKLTEQKSEEIIPRVLIWIYRCMYACSSADNTWASRRAVVGHLHAAGPRLLASHRQTTPEEHFRYDALVVATLVTLLEDDDDVISRHAADVIIRMTIIPTVDNDAADAGDVSLDDATLEDGASLAAVVRAARDNGGRVMASAAGEVVRAHAARLHGAPLLLLLALLDFHAEVKLTDALTEECRVFDQSERYNIFLEESVWTAACADRFVQMYRTEDGNLLEYALSVIRDIKYSFTFQDLCKHNVKLFEDMVKGDFVASDTVNPKIEILVKKLRAQ